MIGFRSVGTGVRRGFCSSFDWYQSRYVQAVVTVTHTDAMRSYWPGLQIEET